MSGVSPAAAAFKSQPAEKNLSAPVRMATRSAGSSRKAANTSPMRRLVGVSIALAFGRSKTTSRMAPLRVTLSGLSVMSSSSVSRIGISAPMAPSSIAWPRAKKTGGSIEPPFDVSDAAVTYLIRSAAEKVKLS